MARRREHYPGGCVLGLSITQVILGVVCIVLQFILIANKSFIYFVGQGIWAGVIFIVAGTLGIASGQRKDSCMIIVYLVMAIIAAVVAVFGLISASAVELSFGTLNSYSIYRSHDALLLMVISVSGTMIVIAVLQAILFIVSSAIACHGLCGGDYNYNAIANNAEMGQVQYDSRGQQAFVHTKR